MSGPPATLSPTENLQSESLSTDSARQHRTAQTVAGNAHPAIAVPSGAVAATAVATPREDSSAAGADPVDDPAFAETNAGGSAAITATVVASVPATTATRIPHRATQNAVDRLTRSSPQNPVVRPVASALPPSARTAILRTPKSHCACGGVGRSGKFLLNFHCSGLYRKRPRVFPASLHVLMPTATNTSPTRSMSSSASVSASSASSVSIGDSTDSLDQLEHSNRSSRRRTGPALSVTGNGRPATPPSAIQKSTASPSHPMDDSSTLFINGSFIDRTSIHKLLKSSLHRLEKNEITLRNVTIDKDVVDGLRELFSAKIAPGLAASPDIAPCHRNLRKTEAPPEPDNRTSHWVKLQLTHCSGRLPDVFEAVYQTGTIAELVFTGSIPIAHNPRYSLTTKCLRAISLSLNPASQPAIQNNHGTGGNGSNDHEDSNDCDSKLSAKGSTPTPVSSSSSSSVTNTRIPLATLCLRGTRIPREGLEYLCRDGLGSPDCPLTTLRLSQLHFQARDFVLLADALATNRRLEVLLLAHCKLSSMTDPGPFRQHITSNEARPVATYPASVGIAGRTNARATAGEPVRSQSPITELSANLPSDAETHSRSRVDSDDEEEEEDTLNDTVGAGDNNDDDAESIESLTVSLSNEQDVEATAMSLVLEALQHHPSLQCLLVYGMRLVPSKHGGAASCSHTVKSNLVSPSVDDGGTSKPNRAIEALQRLLEAPTCQLWHLGLKQNIDDHHNSRNGRGRRQHHRRNGNGRGNDLNRNRLHGQTTEEPVQSLDLQPIAEALRVNRSLRYFQCTGNNVSSTGMRRLCEVLATTSASSSLAGLGLTDNAIDDDGLNAMAEHLPSIRSLRFLDLQRNPFTDRGKAKLIAALENNWYLERLDLDGNPHPVKTYYTALNRGGRRLILQSSTVPTVGTADAERGSPSVPLGLWPLVLERVNRLQFGRSAPNARLDVMYCLIRGPALFERPAPSVSPSSKRRVDSDSENEVPRKRARLSCAETKER